MIGVIFEQHYNANNGATALKVRALPDGRLELRANWINGPVLARPGETLQVRVEAVDGQHHTRFRLSQEFDIPPPACREA